MSLLVAGLAGCGDEGSTGAVVGSDVEDSGATDVTNIVDIADIADIADTAVPPDTTTPDTTPPDTTPTDTSRPDTTPPDTTMPDTSEPVPPCPTITITEGLAVAPPLTLHLSGLTTPGDVATWKWTVVSAPTGLVSVLVPGTGVAEPRFEAALGGEYTFRLEAYDSRGNARCDPAEVTVKATPGPGIHRELIWDDNTEDPSAEFGADLDLHVFRSDAVGLDTNGDSKPDGWFDPIYDCAWHNPNPIWPSAEGVPNPAPRLLRRDDAGYGPEVISVPAPQDAVYVVGFHVWDDEDAVYLAPTEIRVWIDSVWKNRPNFAVPVKAPSLERVMTVTWPSRSLGFPFADDGDFIPTSPTK